MKNSIDLNKSFTKLKNQIMKKSYVELATTQEEEANIRNLAIQQCIDICKQQEMLYGALSPNGNEVTVIQGIIHTLNLLKQIP